MLKVITSSSSFELESVLSRAAIRFSRSYPKTLITSYGFLMQLERSMGRCSCGVLIWQARRNEKTQTRQAFDLESLCCISFKPWHKSHTLPGGDCVLSPPGCLLLLAMKSSTV